MTLSEQAQKGYKSNTLNCPFGFLDAFEWLPLAVT